MAHFAQLNEDSLVLRVLVMNNNHEDNQEGYTWLVATFGGTWLKTSYNGTIRKNFAGIGFTYSQTLDAFIPPTPFDSWVLDEETCQWQAPIPYPDDEKNYSWNESTLSWVEITGE